MKIINQTKDSVLAQNTALADTPFKRMRGLLGTNSLEEGRALVIRPCNSVHTFFMRFPIDVVFVDKNNIVVYCISKMTPFRVSKPCFRASYVIELPPGTIEKSATSTKDRLEFIL